MSTLPIRLEKQISGKCCYSGCGEDALDGSDYCGPHDAHERGRDAGKKRRRRQRLADAGFCREGCGRRVPRKRRPDGSVIQRRCSVCKKLHKRRRVPGETRGVPGESSGEPAKQQWRVDPGTNWMRFRGKGRRGRLTREEQIDEDIRDVGFAHAELEKLARALERLKLPEVMELPAIQREAARRAAGLFISLPMRILDELAEKYR